MPKQLYKKKPAPSTGGQENHPLGETTTREEGQAATPIAEEMANSILPSRKVALGDIPLSAIIPSSAQARTEQNLTPESLQDLVDSMKEHGLITRIRVRPVEGRDDLFELVYGERRWRAAKLAGFTHYPVEIASYTDDELAEVGLIENVQRKDLTALEEAEKYQQLLNIEENGRPKYSIRKLAERIGKDKGYVELRLAVLRSPDNVQQLIRDLPDVPLRAASEIAKVEDEQVRERLITDVREGTIKKVEEVKAAVREATGKPPKDVLPLPIVPLTEQRVRPSPSLSTLLPVPPLVDAVIPSTESENHQKRAESSSQHEVSAALAPTVILAYPERVKHLHMVLQILNTYTQQISEAEPLAEEELLLLGEIKTITQQVVLEEERI